MLLNNRLYPTDDGGGVQDKNAAEQGGSEYSYSLTAAEQHQATGNDDADDRQSGCQRAREHRVKGGADLRPWVHVVFTSFLWESVFVVSNIRIHRFRIVWM